MTRTEIIDFLRLNHKQFDKMTEQNFDVWVTDWENSDEEGYAHIEIDCRNSNSGATIILD